jgi:hypothetical protein
MEPRDSFRTSVRRPHDTTGTAHEATGGVTTRAALAALRLYKTTLSPFFSGSCRYLPSCSDYMAEAIERHGAAAGTALGLRRLARCHPLGGSGFDPVPERRPWRALVARRACADPGVKA